MKTCSTVSERLHRLQLTLHATKISLTFIHTFTGRMDVYSLKKNDLIHGGIAFSSHVSEHPARAHEKIIACTYSGTIISHKSFINFFRVTAPKYSLENCTFQKSELSARSRKKTYTSYTCILKRRRWPYRHITASLWFARVYYVTLDLAHSLTESPAYSLTIPTGVLSRNVDGYKCYRI